jgi:endo-1,4-beta-xylanase
MTPACLIGAGERIKKHRFMDAVLCVKRPDGTPLADAEIVVEQTGHEFLFGTTGSFLLHFIQQLKGWTPDQVEAIKEQIVELFNAATLPFYWGRFEPTEGEPHTGTLREIASWFKAHGFTCKGHTLCWHTVCADWLMKYSNREIYEKQRARVRREVNDFAGLVDMWDVINEVVIMPVYDRYDNAITRIAKEYGPRNLTDTLFRDARETNPNATLLTNDFILNLDYENLVAALIERGTPVDVIGLQTHQHQGYRGAETIWDYAERFSRFNLPLHFTENTLVSGDLMPAQIKDLNDFKTDSWPSLPKGEERQSREAVEIYTLLYSHPAVQSITWWDLIDGGWLNAPSGLLRKDLTPKPVFDALKKLIKGEWWTGKKILKTDQAGQVRLTGALGTYRTTAADSATAFRLEKGVSHINIQF